MVPLPLAIRLIEVIPLFWPKKVAGILVKEAMKLMGILICSNPYFYYGLSYSVNH